MRQLHKAGVALLAGLGGLALGGVAEADTPPGTPQTEAPYAPAGQQGAKPQQGRQGTAADAAGSPENKPKGLGAGLGGQESESTTFVVGPLDTGGLCQGSGMSQGYGAGVGPSGEGNAEGGGQGQPGASASAPVPQYWLADASLFVANARNAAQTLANEQALGVQAPSVLGNQAQFLLASTDRALSSLKALHASAEVTHPRALADIRSAMDELVAAKAQAKQAIEAANSGALGPGDQGTIRSTYEHLQAAERGVEGAGRAFGAQRFTLASGYGGRAMGAGIGGGKGTPGATQPPPKNGATTPVPEKGSPGTTAPEPAPSNEKP
jgi:hypothetical protein